MAEDRKFTRSDVEHIVARVLEKNDVRQPNVKTKIEVQNAIDHMDMWEAMDEDIKRREAEESDKHVLNDIYATCSLYNQIQLGK